MPSLYKNNGIWYVSVSHNNKRISRSLKTKDHKVAKQLKPYAESSIIAELNGYVIKNERLTFSELVPRFLGQNSGWNSNTKRMYET